ncbi:MAG TPA: hypothetical protein VN851_11730 [Thermoanaerobaculia bacterium]|nr:hypothetical protein [Thermoanaerobaculia bacterium]
MKLSTGHWSSTCVSERIFEAGTGCREFPLDGYFDDLFLGSSEHLCCQIQFLESCLVAGVEREAD